MNITPIIHDQFNYGDTEHAHFQDLGYCIFPQFLTPEALQEGQGLIDDMLNRLQSGRPTDDIINAHEQEPWIWKLATQPALLDMIERQVGPSVVFWSSHLLCKPPHSGRHIPWHQDAPYWNIKATFAGAVWIAFDDMDATNGTMSVIPRLHKTALPRRDSGDDAFTEEIDPSALPESLEQVKVKYEFAAGGAATHHTMIPHSSMPNTSDRWRRVLVLRYMAVDGDMPPKSYEDYRTGTPFKREFYLVRGQDVRNQGLKQCPEWEPASII